MNDLFLGGGAAWFTVPALIGTVFFVLRMVLMLVGGDAGGDVDVDVDVGGVDVDTDLSHADPGDAFQILSIQTIAAFLMGFGWGGLGGLKGAGWGVTASFTFGLAGGAGMVWLLAKLLQAVFRLQASGNVGIDQTLDLEGSVYIAIPGDGGRGRVRLIVNNRERFFNAVSEDEVLEPQTRVRVLRVNDDNSVTVTRA
jgi:hypothetical protein